MASVTFKRGTKKDLDKQELTDGLLSFSVDNGQIHMDYMDENNELVRRTFYSGKLTFGKYSFDGTQDVTVTVYEGDVEDNAENTTE